MKRMICSDFITVQSYNLIICKFCAFWKNFFECQLWPLLVTFLFKLVYLPLYILVLWASSFQKRKREIKNLFSNYHNLNFWNICNFSHNFAQVFEYLVTLSQMRLPYWNFFCAILFATWQSTTVPNFRFKAQPYQN